MSALNKEHGSVKPVVLVVCLLLMSLLSVPATATPDETVTEPSMTVYVTDNGHAEVVLVFTFDLESDDDRDAFETLQSDEAAREDIRDRFESRMVRVASDASSATDRTMKVSNATVDIETREDGQLGVVLLSVTWHWLATIENGQLVITEPFASGYESKHSLTIVGPPGFEIESVDPEPTTRSDTMVTWESDTALDGFEVTIDSMTGDPIKSSSSDAQPGFGGAIALIGLALAMYFFRMHDR